jgi:uncharacterized protein (TIGR00255 family)
MIKSMTAYGKAVYTFDLGRIEVEIQAVNRKHLEINVTLPTFLIKHDVDIKKWVAAKIFRGQLNVRVSLIADEGSPVTVNPNRALARQLKGAWDIIAADLGIVINDADYIKILLQEEGLLVYSEETECSSRYCQALEQVMHDAIEHCLQMKIAEGKALGDDILGRLKNIDKLVEEITARAAGASDRYRQKLLLRINEILQAPALEDDRVLREIALFAEKVDVAEEITRLKSHIKQAHDVMSSKSNSIGKTLEFIIQEMNREVNTIGSKCLDVELSRYVIEVKSEIERIREQIQNVE